MEWFSELSNFLSDIPEMKRLLTNNGKAFVSYLDDIFEKLNLLNKQLQGKAKTLVDAKANTFSYISFIVLCQKHISDKNFDQFYWLKKYVTTDAAVLVIVNHLKFLASDLKEKFSDLKQIYFSTWVMHPILEELSDVSTLYQEEVSVIQNNASVKTLFNIKRVRDFVMRRKQKFQVQLALQENCCCHFHLYI